MEFKLRVAVPVPVMDAGVMDAFRLKGGETERLTEPVKPLIPVIETIAVLGPIVLIVIGLGLALMVKSGAMTVTET